MANAMEYVKQTLLHYFNIIHEKATGRPLPWECQNEIEGIADVIQSYIDRRVKEEVHKALQEISNYKEAGK